MRGWITGTLAALVVTILAVPHLDRPYVGAHDGAVLRDVQAALNHVRYSPAVTWLAPCEGKTLEAPARRHPRLSSPRLTSLLGSVALLAGRMRPETVRWIGLVMGVLTALLVPVLSPQRLGGTGRLLAAGIVVAMPAGLYFARLPAADGVFGAMLLGLAAAHQLLVRRSSRGRRAALLAVTFLAVLGGLGALAACAVSAADLRRRAPGRTDRPRPDRRSRSRDTLWPLAGGLLGLLVWGLQNVALVGPGEGLEALFRTGILAPSTRDGFLVSLVAGSREVLGSTALRLALVGLLLGAPWWVAHRFRPRPSPVLLILVLGCAAHLLLGEVTAHRAALLLLPLAPLVAWSAAAGLVWSSKLLRRLRLEALPLMLAAAVFVPLQSEQSLQLARRVSPRALALHQVGRVLAERSAPTDQVVTTMSTPSRILELSAGRKVIYGMKSPAEARRRTRARARCESIWLVTPIDVRPGKRRHGAWTWVIERARDKAIVAGYIVCRDEEPHR